MNAHAAIALTKLSVELVKVLVEVGEEVYKEYKKYKTIKESKDVKRKEVSEYAKGLEQLVPCRHGDVDAMRGTLNLKTAGLFYSGVFVDGELEGPGEMKTPTVHYIGTFKNGLPHGEGRMKYITRDTKYVGNWDEGKRHGFGQLVTSRGSLCSGTFESDNFVFGTIVTPSGIIFTGVCEEYSPVEGKLVYPSGMEYTGRVKEWKWHDDSGNAILTFPTRNAQTGKPYQAVYYKGGFKDCTYDGQGEMLWRTGKLWKGLWIANEMQKDQGVWGKGSKIDV